MNYMQSSLLLPHSSKQISIAIVQGIFDSAGMEMEITEENIDQYLEQYLPQFGDTADEYIKQVAIASFIILLNLASSADCLFCSSSKFFLD